MSQCRGTTKLGKRCNITWELNANGLCKFHQYEDLESKEHIKCRHIKSDGMRCNIHWDLDPITKLCDIHHSQAAMSPVDLRTAEPNPQPSILSTTASSDARKPRQAPVPPPPPPIVRRVAAKKTPVAIAAPPAQPTSAESTSAISDDSSSPCCSRTVTSTPNVDTNDHDGELLPPLWTVRHIASTGTVVVRMYSEVSRRCHHSPVVLLIPSLSKFDNRVVRWIARLCCFLPFVGDAALDTKQELWSKLETVDYIMGVLHKMGIAGEKGGMYSSNGNSRAHDQLLLQCLLDSQTSRLEREYGYRVSQLYPVRSKDNDFIWVTNDEEQHAELTRQPAPVATAMLRFDWVVGRLRRGVTIVWTLKKEATGDMLQKIDGGIACVEEPIPVYGIERSELGQCTLEITVKRNAKYGTRRHDVDPGDSDELLVASDVGEGSLVLGEGSEPREISIGPQQHVLLHVLEA